MNHDTPFLKALLEYASQKVYPFHTPGHKSGRGMHKGFAELLQYALKADVSLMDELDDIHAPSGILDRSQKLAAQLYGADESFFSVNGTTGAIHAMIIGALRPGDKLLLPRNAHRSVNAALVLSGARPVYIYPEYDDDFGIISQITTASIKKSFARNKDIKAVLLTSPDYYGCCTDIKAIADVAHDNGALCLVDEAHGPHLGFSDVLPPSALSQGADIVAQSTHKIVGAMTQCSVLHVKSNMIDSRNMQKVMSLLTTTSPNQLLLASLDAAFGQLAESGREMVEQAAEKAHYMRAGLRTLQNIRLFEPKVFFDFTKVMVNFKNTPFTGFAAAKELREHKIAVELADTQNVLYLVTYADDGRAIDDNIAVLRTLDKQETATEKKTLPTLPENDSVMTPREVFYREKETVSFSASAGRIAAEEITFYPPGIPLLLTGERVNDDVISYCREYWRISGKGSSDKYIDVVKDEK